MILKHNSQLYILVINSV